MSRKNRSTTRRNVLGFIGTTAFVPLFQGQTDGNAEVTLDEECSSASIKIRPPDSETWTGVIEYVEDGSDVIQKPPGGKTVTGGSVASLAVSFSSPEKNIERAYIVEGTTLDGPVVAKETCGTSDGDGTQGAEYECGPGTHSENQSSSKNNETTAQADAANGEINTASDNALVQTIREQLGLE